MTKVVDISADQHAATRRAKNAKKRSHQRRPHPSFQSANARNKNRLMTAVQNARIELTRCLRTENMRYLPMLEIAEAMLDAYMDAPPIYKDGKCIPRLLKAETYVREQFSSVADKDRLKGAIRAVKEELNHQLDLLPVT